MATVGNAPRDVEFSQDDLQLLAKSLKDEKFRGLLGEFAKEISDPIKQKHYESEVKKWEKQRGVDVVFLDPSPGFVVAVGGGEADGDPVCVNICSSDVVQEPSFIRTKQGNTPGHNWSIPHAVTKPRKEVVTGEKQLLRELFRGRGAKRSPSKQLKQLLVHDVVFHPDTLHLASSNYAMRQSVIQTAMDSLSHNYQLKAQNPREIANVKYVGKPVKSVIKKVINKELHSASDKLSFLNKAEDERTSIEADKSENKVENQSTNVSEGDEKPEVPKYLIKHVNKVDLQDYALQLIPQTGPAWRPQALEVQVYLPGVTRASQVDADVWQQSIKLSTASTPQYKLELPLPYAVDEDTSTAKFDVSTQKLTFVLAVMPASKKDQMPLPSPSSDSGIECESGYRTNSDGDNSSEVSVSSQEEVSRDVVGVGGEEEVEEEAQDDDDDESSVFESAPSSPIKACLIPSYTLKQTEEDLCVILNCGNILPSSIDIRQSGTQSVNMKLTSIGGGQTRLNYGITLVSTPNDMAEGSVSHKINDDNVEVVLKKVNPGHWETCQVGHTNCLATVNVAKVEEKSTIVAQPTKDAFLKHGLGDNAPHQNNVAEGHVCRKPRVTRAVSMCEESSVPTMRLKGPTCSWPRGILKRRCRSLSESQLGSVMPLESLMSLETPLEIELLEDGDGEESVEEAIASIMGEKKSVRFNDVVSRQLFRSNSSILGQRAKNQKKALKKQKCRNRHASESDRDSDVSQCHSDPGPSSGDLTTTTTTTDEDDTDATAELEVNLNHVVNSPSSSLGTCNSAFFEVDLDVENNNSAPTIQNTNNLDDDNNNLNNNINNSDQVNDDGDDFVVKTSKKKRKNNKKKNKKFEPSNTFIFQLDIEP